VGTGGGAELLSSLSKKKGGKFFFSERGCEAHEVKKGGKLRCLLLSRKDFFLYS